MKLFLFVFLTTLTTSYYGKSLIEASPPARDKYPLMARYIIHNTDWVSISTISTRKTIKGYPYVNIKSMSDGPISKGSGTPYLYMTPIDLSGLDIEIDNRCSILASLAETDYCKSKEFDPQDPRCARVILTGRLVRVDNTTEEYSFGKNALFSRHPAMETWPIDLHHFYVAKLDDIEEIAVLDNIGAGVHFVTVKDYYNANKEITIDDEFENVVVVDISSV